MFNNYCICITCAGGTLKKQEGVFLKKYSKYKKILTLIGTDKNSNKVSKRVFDYTYQLPSPFSKKYIGSLLNIIKKHKVNLIIACSDEEALEISKNLAKIKKLNCDTLLNKFSTLKILTNKILTYKKLSSMKEIIPYWKEIKNYKQLKIYLKKFLSELGAGVIKPSISRGGRDVFIVEKIVKRKKEKSFGRHKHVNYGDFLKHHIKKFRNKFPIIIMEKLYEPAFDLDIFASKGKIINCLFRKRMTIDGYQGHKILFNNKSIIYSKKIANKLGLDAINDCDFMLNKRKRLKLLEVNPRPSGSLAVPHIAGYNILDSLLDLKIKNIKVKQAFFKKNVSITKKRIDQYNI